MERRVFILVLLLAACGGAEHDDTRWIEPTSSERTRTSTTGEEAESPDETEPRTPVEPAQVDEGVQVADEELACESDEDCVVSTFDSCCSCPSPQYAISRQALEQRELPCGAVDCAEPDCPERISALGDSAEARCAVAQCRLVDGSE